MISRILKKTAGALLGVLVLLGFFSFSAPIAPVEAQADCTIVSATFSPSGKQADGWFSDDTQPRVIITIETENCANKTIEVSLTEQDDIADDDVDDCYPRPCRLDNGQFVISAAEELVLELAAGEDECENIDALGPNGADLIPDCNYHIEVWDPAGNEFNSRNTPNGTLMYECDTAGITGGCGKDWRLLMTNEETGSDFTPGTGVVPTYSAGDPCVNPEGTGLIDDCYAPLAPLPLLPNEIKSDFSLGQYINVIFQIVIGIAGVIAVVMVIVGGVQYMTTDALAGKSNARETITGALIGLLIILASFIILNTINPNLTTIDPNIQELTIAFSSTPGSDGHVLEIDGSTAPADQESPQFRQWARDNSKAITLTKQDGTKVDIKACEQDNMQYVTAFNMPPFRVHKLVAPSILRIHTAWENAGGDSFYKIPKSGGGGGYNCRLTKGNNGISLHAYGLAVDINPTQNPFGENLVTDMPPAFVQMWKNEGWGWGGDWVNVKDAMHFSKEIREQGNQRVD